MGLRSRAKSLLFAVLVFFVGLLMIYQRTSSNASHHAGVIEAVRLLDNTADDTVAISDYFTTDPPAPPKSIKSDIKKDMKKIVKTTTVVPSSLPTKNVSTTRSSKPSITFKPVVDTSKAYVVGAYLVDDVTVRLTTVRRCGSRLPLRLYVPSPNATEKIIAVKATLSTIGTPCPWWFQKKCLYVGYYATFRLPPNVSLADSATVDIGGNDRRLQTVPLKDARAVDSPKHRLAVCLQPVFLFAEWTLLIQFLEFWQHAGATKFYFYLQTIAPEVDRILRIYEQDSRIEIERVDWSFFPGGDESASDPNNLVYRTEVVTGINDCLHRARGEAFYVVSADFDEMILPFHNRTLLQLLDAYQKKFPKLGAFHFRSSNARVRHSYHNLTQPELLSFDELGVVQLERKVWEVGSRSKIILRPERVKRSHVHSISEMDGKRFSYTTIPPSDALVYHMRRVKERNPESESVANDALAKYTGPLTVNWRKRFTEHAPPDGLVLPNRGLAIMDQLESCLVHYFAQREKLCNSPYRCRHNFTAIQPAEWVTAASSWTAV
uniref:Glycosyltransferase family 92 protein n=1 Tax=Plectus sambesii TaxID=2011161 RepID=A0A914WDI4_9BILA